MQIIPKNPGQRRQFQRRNLRIAIRQLERAELYIAALRSLDLDGPSQERIEELLADLSALHQHFLADKAAS